jgi:hypothetical protein
MVVALVLVRMAYAFPTASIAEARAAQSPQATTPAAVRLFGATQTLRTLDGIGCDRAPCLMGIFKCGLGSSRNYGRQLACVYCRLASELRCPNPWIDSYGSAHPVNIFGLR